MALIVCENCGKTYSNTVASCIHCGNPTPYFNINTNDYSNYSYNEPQETTPAEIYNTTAPTKMIDLSLEYQLDLESEFLEVNEWALGFEQKRRTNTLFRKASMVCFATGLASALLLIYFAYLIANVEFLKITLVWIFILFIVGIIGTIFFAIRGIKLNTCNESIEWSKQYQIWLKEQKNIIVED